MATSIDAASPLNLAARVGELVQIPSVNPLQAGPISGPGGEGDLARAVADRAEALGATVTLDSVLSSSETGDRPNVYAHFQGPPGAPTLVVDAHLDTVSIEHMTDDPFDGRIADDRVYGRGSVDTKASFAVVLAVLEAMQAEGEPLGVDLWLVGTIAEEVGGLIGAGAFRRWVRKSGLEIDRLIVAEPTMCAPVHGHRGAIGLEITVNGKAAHSSQPELGANAISAAGRIIAALDAEHERITAAGGSTPVGPGTLSVTEIGGGRARNIIPDCCTVYAGRRTAPGEDVTEVFNDLAALIKEAAMPLEAITELAYGAGSPAFYQEPDSGFIKELCELAGTVPEAATYGSNALSYGGLAKETVLFGPGSIDQAHQAVEWVDIDQLDQAAKVYRTLLRG